MVERLCQTQDPRCTGLQPCVACWETIQGEIVPAAMGIAGGPFSADPRTAHVFMLAFAQAWGQTFRRRSATVPPPGQGFVAHGMEAMEGQGQPMGQVVRPPPSTDARAFVEAFAVEALRMGPDGAREMIRSIAAGENPDFVVLSPGHQKLALMVLDRVASGAQPSGQNPGATEGSVGEEAPQGEMPSQDSAMRFVSEMTSGRVGAPDTSGAGATAPAAEEQQQTQTTPAPQVSGAVEASATVAEAVAVESSAGPSNGVGLQEQAP